MTAAQMRKMMEGVVLFGSGKGAQLNGYSSGGKTGTAQKIDPATHTYSKTMHIASFTGFAPVNNPVIAIAVIMDSPKGQYYGAEVSAPVFAEVAQQVLEYLGVPHDIDLRPAAASKADKPITEDDAPQSEEDIKALYDAANDLPSDDPLSAAQVQAASKAASPQPAAAQAQSSEQPAPAATPQPAKTVTLGDANRLRVPSLLGLPVRKVIEQAAAAGLEVQIIGSGTSRQQAPDPGAMVPPGTKIVVRCGTK
jgi:cell division protein FtsI (penicillin-binding protein 3)